MGVSLGQKSGCSILNVNKFGILNLLYRQRYVTVLPPVHLGINIDTDIFVTDAPQDGDQLLASNQEFPSVEGTVKIDHPLGNGQETASGRDPKYYHNALTCVVLGVVVMIILFFVCKFLNDLQVNPRSGRGRKGKRHRCDTLVESVPISLRGHTQVGMTCVFDGLFLAICTDMKFRSSWPSLFASLGFPF